MAFMTTRTEICFRMPHDKELHENFVKTHDISEWDQKRIGPFLSYLKEESSVIKDIGKF